MGSAETNDEAIAYTYDDLLKSSYKLGDDQTKSENIRVARRLTDIIEYNYRSDADFVRKFNKYWPVPILSANLIHKHKTGALGLTKQWCCLYIKFFREQLSSE